MVSSDVNTFIGANFHRSELAALCRSIGKYDGKYLQKNEDCVKPTARFPVTVFLDLQANHLAVF